MAKKTNTAMLKVVKQMEELRKGLKLQKRTIARVEKPTQEHGLYRVWFSQDGHEFPADMTEKSYKVLMIEEHLTNKLGYDRKALQEYRDAIVEERDEEHEYDED